MTPTTQAGATSADETAMSRALEIIDALPTKLRPDDAVPLRDALPGGWPTIGDLRAALASPAVVPESVRGSRYGLIEASDSLRAAIQENHEAHERAGAREKGALEKALDILCRFYGYTGDYRRGFVWMVVRDLLTNSPAAIADAQPLGRAAEGGEDDTHRCGICDEPLIEGQMVLTDVELGEVHATCCGPERDSYVKNIETGEPLGPNDPIPAGRPYIAPTPPASAGDVEGSRLEEVNKAIVAALGTVNIESEADQYELCGDDGDYTPTEDERALLVDFAYGLMLLVHEAVRPLVLATAPAAPEPAAGGKTYERVRHVKRGTEYEVLGEAEAQVSVGGKIYVPCANVVARQLYDGMRLTVYRGSDGKLWCRFTDEFRDGRFETVSTPTRADAGAEGRR